MSESVNEFEVWYVNSEYGATWLCTARTLGNFLALRNIVEVSDQEPGLRILRNFVGRRDYAVCPDLVAYNALFVQSQFALPAVMCLSTDTFHSWFPACLNVAMALVVLERAFEDNSAVEQSNDSFTVRLSVFSLTNVDILTDSDLFYRGNKYNKTRIKKDPVGVKLVVFEYCLHPLSRRPVCLSSSHSTMWVLCSSERFIHSALFMTPVIFPVDLISPLILASYASSPNFVL